MYTEFIFKRKKVIFRLLVVFLTVCLWVTELTGWVCGAARGARLSAEPDGGGGVRICLDPCLSEIGDGGAVAFSVTLTLSEGWSWGEIAPTEGAAGMICTVGDVSEDGRTVKILLDGYPEGGSRRLLRMETKGSLTAKPLEVKITEADGIYYRSGSGDIKKIPLSAEDFSTGKEDDTTAAERETNPPPPPGEEGETTSPNRETEEASPPPSMPPPSCPSALTGFAGCQETPVTDGFFSVRFLFYRPSPGKMPGKMPGDTPVVCFGRGGVLQADTAEISMDEGDFTALTFRGLCEEGEYTFLVYTEEGVVEVLYGGGRFLGMKSARRFRV